ncbi:MAG: protein-L-isoaspartate(D-aspartate) O-methyltransferase [Candidatus Promineifilaceae bacterium]
MQPIAERREEMVTEQLMGRGVRDPAVLRAMRAVPREAFVSPDLAEFAYEDTALPIAEGQTISQPYIVAATAEFLELEPSDRVLEVGAGSGYAAAVLAHIADQVYAIERHQALMEAAEARFRRLGYANIRLRQGDGSQGWPEHAPFDAVLVSAGGEEPPPALLEQLAVGGRLLIPIGPALRLQELKRYRKTAEGEFEEEELGAVRFVPLVTEAAQEPAAGARLGASWTPDQSLAELIAAAAEPIPTIDEVELGGLLERIGEARAVLIGESSHGTAEFYALRARITQALIQYKGFNIVAIEGDWPDAAEVDRYTRQLASAPPAPPLSSERSGPAEALREDISAFGKGYLSEEHTIEAALAGRPRRPFGHFPAWMWTNRQTLEFVEWLRDYNARFKDPDEAVGFYGLDLYSLDASIDAVLEYLDEAHPESAAVARQRYARLTPWEGEPASYGAAVLSGRYRECADEVVAALQGLLDKRLAYIGRDGSRYFDTAQNARLVANAERYYRLMYYGSRPSWNLRDSHMFETLQALLAQRGPAAKAVVWAHNSHVGDAAATEMGARGAINIGRLCRRNFGDGAHLIGMGTDHGTVMAASEWGGAPQVMELRPAAAQSYERLCHDSGRPAFLLPLRAPAVAGLRRRLMDERLERAVGVIYQPEQELQSHYFFAQLPRQFDEYAWFDESRALTPFDPEIAERRPDTFPF